MKHNKHVTKINLNKNSIKYKHVLEINSYCKRNLANIEKKDLPQIKEEIAELMKNDKGEKISSADCIGDVNKIIYEREHIEMELHEGHNILTDMRDEDKMMVDDLKHEKKRLIEQGKDMVEEIDSLDLQLVHKERKLQEELYSLEQGLAKIQNCEHEKKDEIKQEREKLRIAKAEREEHAKRMEGAIENTLKQQKMSKLVHDNYEREVIRLREELEKQDQLDQEGLRSSTRSSPVRKVGGGYMLVTTPLNQKQAPKL